MSNKRDSLWGEHERQWRDTAQIASQWEEARGVEPSLLRFRQRGAFWETLDRLKATLLLTREYEHLVIGLTVLEGKPLATYMRLPHPSGLIYDRNRRVVHLASTRNPNQIFELRPVTGLARRKDVRLEPLEARPLVPVSARFYPGSTYLHDLGLVGGKLYANAVGENAVVRVEDDGRLTRAFWPTCIEQRGRARFDRNHIQLNSIAAGATIRSSFFSASADTITSRRPGHRDYPVDGRGVIFSGSTREPVARNLTRPHSARLHRRQLWVANSGYGELGKIVGDRFERVAALPGWTRGLAFVKGIAFVGTSRVIPRFRRYAPGLDVDKSRCAVHAVDATTGRTLGSLTWPTGNQIFAIDWAPRNVVSGFPFSARARGDGRRAKQLFYAFQTGDSSNMTEDFRFLLLSAMYENGGNTTHRFLDGHPQMFVYPFESQLGTKLVSDMLTSTFPVKYRWPVFDLAASPAEDYHAIIDEECKVRARTPFVSKFRDTPFDFSDDDRKAHYIEHVNASGRSRANNMAAFFRATFDAWKDYRRTGEQSVYVGYSPIVVVDAQKIVEDLPGAHVLHIVRNPWSAYADTKKRPVPLSLSSYLLGWTLNQYYALQCRELYPGRVHVLRLEDILAEPRRVLGGLCDELGLDAAESLSTPSFNAAPLEQVYPWGTIRAATTEANRATAGELSTAEQDSVRARAEPYLEKLDYKSFL